MLGCGWCQRSAWHLSSPGALHAQLRRDAISEIGLTGQRDVGEWSHTCVESQRDKKSQENSQQESRQKKAGKKQAGGTKKDSPYLLAPTSMNSDLRPLSETRSEGPG